MFFHFSRDAFVHTARLLLQDLGYMDYDAVEVSRGSFWIEFLHSPQQKTHLRFHRAVISNRFSHIAIYYCTFGIHSVLTSALYAADAKLY